MQTSPRCEIGVIGGSGLYQLADFQLEEELVLTTPWGEPSDAYFIGQLAGQSVAFLPRHGRTHRLLPHELPHRANIYGFKQLGVKWLISVSAVGSLQEPFAPGQIVLPDQFFDRTKNPQSHTFFGNGIAAHVSFGQPISLELQAVLHQACLEAGATVHRGGTYVAMEGPQFSTRAESEDYRRSGHAVIGMTNLGEAKLAREAEIAYANMAMVTDYDCWRVGHEEVTVEAVIAVLKANAQLAQRVLTLALPQVAALPPAPAHQALRTAILTPKELWPESTREKLAAILAPY
jgi:5'-methylthioadenosine phosphorylase